jgi:hypothetical protein
MKKTIIAALLAGSCLPAFAANYFVVVPVPNRTPTAGNILVTLSGYTLPAGVVGRAYAGFDFNSVLQVQGDPNFVASSVRWSAGALPAGMTLSSTGKLNGVPTTGGTSTIQVLASYKTKAGQQGYQVFVADVAVALLSAALPDGVQGATYSYDFKSRLSVTGDSQFTPAQVTWSSIGSLPTGLQLQADGTLTGIPTVAGTYAFKVQASYLNKDGQQDYQVLVGAITVALGNATLPAGVQGAAYSYDLKQKLSISGDAAYAGAGVTWSLTSGSLPAGLSLGADGVINGTPTAENAGTPFTIQAAYKTKAGQQSYSVLVGAITVTLKGSTAPAATVGQAYNSGNGWDLQPNLTIAGDAGYKNDGAGVTWAVTGGALPAGLALNSNGTVTGTPTGSSGTNPLQVTAAYKSKSTAQSYTIPFTGGITQYSGYRAWSDGSMAKSCLEYFNGKTGFAYAGATGTGVYRVDVDGSGALTPVDVVCDMTNDGGGWTVFQRRTNGAVNFYQTYAAYAAGFGAAATEYWMGNDRLAALTAAGATTLRIDLTRYTGATGYAKYAGFKVATAADAYRLSLTYSGGTIGDSLTYQNGMQFTTQDVDHDPYPDNCAVTFHGAWWYNSCHQSNLNGGYLHGVHTSYADGMEWNTWTGQYESMVKTEMKVR